MMGNESTPFTMPVAPANTNGNGMFGDGGWWLFILFLFPFIFGGGWGNGWGGNGGNGYVGAEVQRGFDNQAVIMKLDGITQGICDSTYALNNTMTNGFHGVNNALCNLGYNLQSQISDCCCQTQRAIDGVNYNMATQACDTRNVIQNGIRDVIDNANANSRAILDFLTNDKIDALRSENQALKFQASQTAQNSYLAAMSEAQTAELVRRINPQPVPAWTVPNPYAGVFGGYGCGCNPCGAAC